MCQNLKKIKKEPWEMTQKEFVMMKAKNVSLQRREELEKRAIEENSDPMRIGSESSSGSAKMTLGAPNIAQKMLDGIDADKRVQAKRHARLVQQALIKGLFVPKEVLNDYPNLQAFCSSKTKIKNINNYANINRTKRTGST